MSQDSNKDENGRKTTNRGKTDFLEYFRMRSTTRKSRIRTITGIQLSKLVSKSARHNGLAFLLLVQFCQIDESGMNIYNKTINKNGVKNKLAELLCIKIS